MASIRKLKQEINRMTFELISDAFGMLENNPDLRSEDVAGIISDMVESRNNLIKKINDPDRFPDGVPNHRHYNEIREELIRETDRSFTRLSKLLNK